MKFAIPAGTMFGPESQPFFDWIIMSGVNPAEIDPGHLITIHADERGVWYLDGVTAFAVERSWQLGPLETLSDHEAILRWLEAEFGPKSVDLSHMADKVEQLREARRIAGEQKAIADELRAEILGAMTAAGAVTAIVNGEPFLLDKLVPTSNFNRKAFAAAYPELEAQYVTTYDQHRLEFVK